MTEQEALSRFVIVGDALAYAVANMLDECPVTGLEQQLREPWRAWWQARCDFAHVTNPESNPAPQEAREESNDHNA